MKIKKGFTLIEIIVSIALIGIISVITLSIFNTGLINITKAGKRTIEVANLKQLVDIKIITPVEDESPNIIVNPIELKVIGLIPTNVTITGQDIIVISPLDSDFNIKIETFIPNINQTSE